MSDISGNPCCHQFTSPHFALPQGQSALQGPNSNSKCCKFLGYCEHAGDMLEIPRGFLGGLKLFMAHSFALGNIPTELGASFVANLGKIR